jgi:hypothetical protein
MANISDPDLMLLKWSPPAIDGEDEDVGEQDDENGDSEGDENQGGNNEEQEQ